MQNKKEGAAFLEISSFIIEMLIRHSKRALENITLL